MGAVNSTQKHRHPGFQPGQSGNPRGKPPGARNKALIALDAIGQEGAEAALQAVVKAAAGGATYGAAELLLSRCWPARKGHPVTLPLPDVSTAEGVTAALAAVVRATAAGTLTPDEAAALVGLLEAQRRAIETDEIERRVAGLEAMAPQTRRESL